MTADYAEEAAPLRWSKCHTEARQRKKTGHVLAPPDEGKATPNSDATTVAENKERDMTAFQRFRNELDQFIANRKQRGAKYMRYAPRYFSRLTGHPLAGVQIFLPPTTEQEGRLLYVSTSMKVYFGEIAPILDIEECVALGIPEEDPNHARAGQYQAFRVVGQEGFSNLLSMGTDKSALSSTALNSMPRGIDPLGLNGLDEVMNEHDMTCAESELQDEEALEDALEEED